MTLATTPRIEPLAPPYPPDLAAELERWMPPGSPVEPLALFRVLCRNRPLAQAMLPLGSFQLSKRSGIPRRLRELVINRTCARLGAEYEWGVHVTAFAAAAGLSDADVETTTVPGSTHWQGSDELVIRLVDELVDQHTIGNELWSDLRQTFTVEQSLELVVLCGWYHLLSFVINAAALLPEPWAGRFPGTSNRRA